MYVDSGTRGEFFGFLDRFVRGVGRSSGDDGDAPGCDFDGGVDHVQPFIVSERGRLAGGAAGNEKINAGLDLPRDQIAQGCVVDRAILMKRSYERGATATELHRNRITRMRVEGNSTAQFTNTSSFARWTAEGGCPHGSYRFPPDVLEIVEALFPGEPFGGADGAFGEAAAGFGVVAEIDAVGGGFEDDLVQADDVAFAEGCDLDILLCGRWLRG